jgi:hypothetical protein
VPPRFLGAPTLRSYAKLSIAIWSRQSGRLRSGGDRRTPIFDQLVPHPRGSSRASRHGQIFVQYADRTFSFTDCTSFALMRTMELTEAFTFDRTDFRAAGFVPVGSL